MGTTGPTPRPELALVQPQDRDGSGDGAGTRPRLYQQVAQQVAIVSSLGTVFYTPGGAAGWALDLALRLYLAYARRMASARAARARRVLSRAPRVVEV
jgi:hypothetical protein